nr:alpha-tubulin N-acetyltransferase 1-like isoform X1 [Oncorhynchus nerka]
MMAYDRPSPKFLSFLEKHYCLKNSVPQVNNFVVFDGFFAKKSAAQLRKVPPKKPDGEIKPYSLTEREAVREEQRALPWPLCRHAAPPLSPPLSVSSPCSPSRGRQRPDPALAPAPAPGANRGPNPQPPLINSLNCRAKRTRKEPLRAQTIMMTTREPDRQAETDTRVLEKGLRKGLAGEPFPGRGRGEGGGPLEVVEKGPSEPERDRGRGGSSWGVGGGPLVVVEKGPSKPERDMGTGGWSWMLGESCCNTAQWARQDYRNTRPW